MQKTIQSKDIKNLLLSSLGGALEYYDFILFVVFSRYISHHFFPESMNDFWKSFFVYSTFASGYLARPLGGIIMAHFGDRLGRKNMFLASILLIVIPTSLLSILPTYTTLGIFAPLFLIFVRVAQGVAVGGEVPCSWVFLGEHTPSKYHGFFLGFLTASIAVGILLGSIVSLILHQIFCESVMQEWGWRIPFFIGGIFGLISIYLRKFLSETPIFVDLKKEGKIESFPLLQIFKHNKQETILAMLSACVLAGCVISLTLFFPKFIGEIFKWDISHNNILQIFGLLFYFAGCILFGILRDKTNIVKSCLVFSLLLLLSTLLLCYGLYYLHHSLIFVIACYLLACFSSGIVNFCPIMIVGLFKPQVRLSGISFSYNLAQAIMGGITPPLIFILHTFSKSHSALASPLVVYAYFVFLILLVGVSIFWLSKIKPNQELRGGEGKPQKLS